jgi:LysM repeat protein
MMGITRGCNTTASVPASQAGYEGSTPFTRSILLRHSTRKIQVWFRRNKLMKFLFTIILILTLAGCKTAQAPYRINTTVIGGVYHYVRSGETLWGISKQYGVDINTLAKANNLENECGDIARGQKLLIPGATRREYTPKTAFTPDYRPFTWPLRGAVVSCFGAKLDMTRNKGIDIRAEEGSSVKASKAGKVVFCDEWLKGFGKTVILDHGDSFQTVYAYNSIIMVNLGDFVEKNTVIAKVGRGGRAKEPSLHFEIRRDGEPQNPYYYLSR